MLKFNEVLLRKYAKLAVVRGVNLKKGQDLIITANVRDEYFVKYLLEEAYNAVASRKIKES